MWNTVRLLLAASLLAFIVPAYAQDKGNKKEADAKPKTEESAKENAPAEGEATADAENEGAPSGHARIYVIKVDEPVTEALLYYIRRGVKEAVDEEADALVLNMDTPGGRVDVTEEIMDLLMKFQTHGTTYTYVNDEAVSAGSFISCATQHIYFAPTGVMGAAAPVMMGGEDIQETMQLKINSYLRGKIRAVARKNGHRPDVFEAMIDPDFELKIGDREIKPKGELLTLTADEALEEVGDPPAPLLSAGTEPTIESLLETIGAKDAVVRTIEPTGYEQAAYWITAVAPVLMGLVTILLFLEFQTQGFGIFGIAAISIVVIYFFGHYVAGLSGNEAWVIFVIGVALLAVEFFLLPGTFVFASIGLVMIVGGLLWAMVDYFPADPITLENLNLLQPLINLSIAGLISFAGIGVLLAVMPKVVRFSELEKATVKGAGHDVEQDTSTLPQPGATGEALTPLRPAGTARFGELRVDVVSDGRMIARGAGVRVDRVEGMRVVVTPVKDDGDASA